MVSLIREKNKLCIKCLKLGHFSRQCSSSNRCRKCQKPHHTLIYNDGKGSFQSELPSQALAVKSSVSSNTATGFVSNALLMTCQLLVYTSDGSHVKACGLLDSASLASYVSEHLAQALCLPQSSRMDSISGMAGLSHKSPLHSVTTFNISAISSLSEKLQVTAVVVQHVTCNLPLQPVSV